MIETFPKVLNGRFKITGVLGSPGGFGQTYRADDMHKLGSKCAVKKLVYQTSNQNELLKVQSFFDKEAKVLLEVGENHSQIPSLIAYFQENQDFYLVQELIEGPTLREKLNAFNALSINQALLLLEEILHILDFIHKNKIIHRDIKPENIILRKNDGRPVLIDFGAVKRVFSEHTLSKGTCIFSEGYSPDEQKKGYPEYSSDIYALGITIIEALTELESDVISQSLRTRTMHWEKFGIYDKELSNVLDKMTQSDVRLRYSSANKILCELAKHSSKESTQTRQRSLNRTLIVSPSLTPKFSTSRNSQSNICSLTQPSSIISTQHQAVEKTQKNISIKALLKHSKALVGIAIVPVISLTAFTISNHLISTSLKSREEAIPKQRVINTESLQSTGSVKINERIDPSISPGSPANSNQFESPPISQEEGGIFLRPSNSNNIEKQNSENNQIPEIEQMSLDNNLLEQEMNVISDEEINENGIFLRPESLKEDSNNQSQ